MDKVSKIFNTLLFILFISLSLIVALRPSTNPVIFIYSLKRLAIIALLAAFSFYFAASVFLRRLSEINILVFFSSLTGIILFEITFSVCPKFVPVSFIPFLERPLKERAITAHGLRKKSDFVGEELCYYYKPFTRLDFNNTVDDLKGTILIDDIGFRNSVFNQHKVDIVLLGDSLIFGGSSPIDLGDLLRKKGFSVLNLAMGGYAPQHWTDVFVKFGSRASPTYVFAFLFDGNDFYDAVNYYSNSIINNSYEGYLNRESKVSMYVNKKSLLDFIINRSYFLSFARGLILSPGFIFKEDPLFKKAKYILDINGKRMTMEFTHSTPPPDVVKSDGFRLTIASIKRLKEECLKIKAKLFLVYVPANSTVCAPYSENYKFKVDDQRAISNKIQNFCEKEGILFIDITGRFQAEVANRKIYLDNGTDTHMRPEGFELLSSIILEEIKH